MPTKIALLALVLILAACAADTAETADTSSTTTSTTTTTIATTTTTVPATSTTVPATTTTTEQTIDVEIRDGQVTAPDRFQVARGEMASITILSDTVYEIHVHGYDLRYDVEPGEPYTIEFPADVPGIFEVETHPDHLLLFELEVGG